MTPDRLGNLKRLLAPRHVAFVGGNSAELAAQQCVAGGYGGEIWGVNPKRDQMAGQPCYARVEDLPGGPDAVFLAVPSAVAIDAVDALRRSGAGGIVCYSAGFGELGAEGAARERDMIEAAGDMAFVGPNCSGILNYVESAALWPFDHGGSPGGKPVERGAAFITQSGMLGNTVTMNQRNLPFAYVISSGNQGMLGVEDFLDVLIDDPKVSAIGLYIEGLRDIRKFADAAIRALQAGKPIVAQKVGTSEIGAQLTITHTGSLSGTDELYQALFDRLGVIRVKSTVTMMETLKLITIAGVPKGGRLAGLTCSGGDSTMLADGGELLGLIFPSASPAVAQALEEILPPIATVANPLDYTTPLWGHEEPLIRAFGAMFEDDYDAAIMVQDYPVLVGGESYAPYLADAQAFEIATKAAGIPGVVCSILPENLDGEVRDLIAAGGVAPLQGINDALQALAGAARFGILREAVGDKVDGLRLLPTIGGGASGRMLDEWEAKQQLAVAGIHAPDGRLVDASGAAAAAEEIGFPVVVKLVSSALPHKTEAGAVWMGLRNASAVNEAVDAIKTSVKAYDPKVDTKMFLVERMIEGTVAELLVGVRHDPMFGLVMVIGGGGTMAELMHDTCVLLLPTPRAAICDSVASLKTSQLLNGFRGAPAADREVLINTILAVAEFAVANAETLLELDINPLMVTANGAWAADALLVKV
ncbi:MAG: acetate--CoA ligase family protein [Rhodospirillales bacterium]|nr:acetate--CoA ligase family protein [Rhodospirillales bacterium]